MTGRAKKQVESDENPGAPEWMVTFSDCMTLLLTFFVLLLSFSSFDDREFRRLQVIYTTGLNSITPIVQSDKDALLNLPPVKRIVELDKGSEKATLAQGATDGLLKESRPVTFNDGMAFLIPSKKVFWGKGTVFSPDGRDAMDTMASFLRGVPSRIVISENGPADDQDSAYFGLPRAWVVMEYLTTRQNLGRERFSISAASTLAQEGFAGGEPDSARPAPERTVEIVLLERSVYN
ncbi:MAG: flagellar motor protein MotB [Planctomycetota bacterium]|jgi:chemotaxis protein MotB